MKKSVWIVLIIITLVVISGILLTIFFTPNVGKSSLDISKINAKEQIEKEIKEPKKVEINPNKIVLNKSDFDLSQFDQNINNDRDFDLSNKDINFINNKINNLKVKPQNVKQTNKEVQSEPNVTDEVSFNIKPLQPMVEENSNKSQFSPSDIDYFKVLGMKGNTYPFKEKHPQQSSSGHYIITSSFSNGQRVTEVEPNCRNIVGYLTENKIPTSNIVAIFDDDWRVQKIQETQFIKPEGSCCTVASKIITVTYDSNGKEITRTTTTLNK